MIEDLWFHAQLLFIDGFLLHGVCHPLDIQTQQLSPEYSPESPLSIFLASVLFFPRMVLYASLRYSLRNPASIILSSLQVAVNRLIPTAEIWACFTPLPTLKTWTLCFICLLLPVTETPRRHSYHTIALFIFHNYNFSSSDPVRAELLKLSPPLTPLNSLPLPITLAKFYSKHLHHLWTCPSATYTRPSSTLTSLSIMIQQLPHY